MANEKFTQLPTVTNATLSDIICAVQGGVSSQETLQQVINLGLAQTILSFAGNPNSNVAGNTFQFCWDTSDSILYICTTSGSTVTAVWTQVAYPASLITPVYGGTGVASPTAHAIPIAEGSSNFTFQTLTNGQVLIGSTGADPIAATITAGTNIGIVNAGGSITISATGSGGFTWTHVTGTSQAMNSNNGYIADNGSLVTLALPTTSVLGDELQIIGRGAGGWAISQTTGQQIIVGSSSSTSGAGGSIASTNRRDAIYLVCTANNTEWTAAAAPQGNITIV